MAKPLVTSSLTRWGAEPNESSGLRTFSSTAQFPPQDPGVLLGRIRGVRIRRKPHFAKRASPGHLLFSQIKCYEYVGYSAADR